MTLGVDRFAVGGGSAAAHRFAPRKFNLVLLTAITQESEIPMFASLFADATLFASRSGSNFGFIILLLVIVFIVAGRRRR